MSAIGDYIYYTYFCYEKGYHSKNAPQRNFTKAFDAYKVFNDKIRSINKTFQGLGDAQTAYEYQQVLNLYSGSNSKETNRIKVEQYLTEHLEEQLGRKISNIDLKGMAVDAPIAVLDKKYAEALIQLKKKTNDRVTFVNNLKLLLEAAENNKALIESVMTGNKPLESLENRITILKNLISKLDVNKQNFLDGYEGKKNSAEYRALQKLDKLFKNGANITGFYEKHAKGSGILNEIWHLLNTVVLPPSAEIGEVTEYIVYDIPIFAQYIGQKKVIDTLSEGVIGGRKSQTAFKVDAIDDVDKFLKENKQYQFLNVDGTGYIVTNTPLQEKIDVSFLVEDVSGKYKELNVSVKNTSKSIIYFIQEGSLWNMIANENYNDFINHYINVVAPKVKTEQNFLAFQSEKDKDPSINHIVTVDYEKAVKENGGRYNLAERAMNQLVIAKALAGYNITKVSKGTVNIMKMPNYLAVFDSYQGTNEWMVKSMQDIYNYFVNSDQGIIISQNNQGQNTTNPFPTKASVLMGPSYKGKNGQEWSQQESVIKSRIASTLNFMHQRKLDVYMKKALLRQYN